MRDWGVDEALALMRAQNEPGELVVRSGEPVGEPTDVPGAYACRRIDPTALAAGRIWPQSRGSQLAALVVGSRDGERVLDACAAPGGKATMLRGEVTAVELHAGPRPRAGGERPPARRDERPRRATPTCASSPRAASTARSSTRRARASACSPAAPTSAGAARPLPELQLELLRAAAERTQPGGTVVYSVCTLNADENEAVVDAGRPRAGAAREEWPQFAHPKRPEFLLTTPHRHGTSGFFIARLRAR